MMLYPGESVQTMTVREVHCRRVLRERCATPFLKGDDEILCLWEQAGTPLRQLRYTAVVMSPECTVRTITLMMDDTVLVAR